MESYGNMPVCGPSLFKIMLVMRLNELLRYQVIKKDYDSGCWHCEKNVICLLCNTYSSFL